MSAILIYKIYWKTSAVRTTCLNGWNSILQAAWYIRHVRIIWFLWTKHTIWLLYWVLHNISSARVLCFIMKDIRSVTPLDAARANRTIFHNHSVHWYYITLIKGRDYIKHDMNRRHGKQNPRRGRWLQCVSMILLHDLINRRAVISLCRRSII